MSAPNDPAAVLVVPRDRRRREVVSCELLADCVELLDAGDKRVEAVHRLGAVVGETPEEAFRGQVVVDPGGDVDPDTRLDACPADLELDVPDHRCGEPREMSTGVGNPKLGAADELVVQRHLPHRAVRDGGGQPPVRR